jgi:hypothetical protein
MQVSLESPIDNSYLIGMGYVALSYIYYMA